MLRDLAIPDSASGAGAAEQYPRLGVL